MPKKKKSEKETETPFSPETLPWSVLKKRYRRPRRSYTRRKPFIAKHIKLAQEREFEPQPSTSSAPDPVFNPQPSTSSTPDPVYPSYVTPENLNRYQGSPPGTCAMLQYSRSKDGSWNFHKDYLNYVMRAYKDSPDWRDLKAKRFNTSFLHEIPRGDRDIKIFSSDEEDSEIQAENMRILEKYKDLFEKLPIITAEEDKEFKKVQLSVKKRRGRKQTREKRFHGSLYSDEALDDLFNWDKYKFSDSEENADDEQEEQKKLQKKGTTAKKGRKKAKKGRESDDEFEVPNKVKKSMNNQGKSVIPKQRSKVGKANKNNYSDQVRAKQSSELNECDRVLEKEPKERRKSTRNVVKKYYSEINSDDDDDNVEVLIGDSNSILSVSQSASKVEKNKQKMPVKGKNYSSDDDHHQNVSDELKCRNPLKLDCDQMTKFYHVKNVIDNGGNNTDQTRAERSSFESNQGDRILEKGSRKSRRNVKRKYYEKN